MKLMIVSGARPNYMKVAPLVWALRSLEGPAAGIRTVLVHTGQHYDPELFDVFFRELDLPPPDYNLGVGSGSQAAQTAEVMIRFEPVVEKERPDVVVVVGDVNSTLACALTAVKMGVQVAHVEAGLRSFDRQMPEEINRILTDAISDYLFTTERSANENLQREGLPGEKVFFVGNVMIDTMLRKRSFWETRQGPLARHPGWERYGLLTLHRPSNVEEKGRLQELLEAVFEIGERLPIIFPCHPRTRKRIEAYGLLGRWHDQPEGSRVRLVDPLGYLDFVSLMARARLVLTDSGGIQEETTVLGVPCLTLRSQTERPVTVTEGTNVVVGTAKGRIVEHAMAVLNDGSCGRRTPELWDGRAADRIVAILLDGRDRGAASVTSPGPALGAAGAPS